MKEGKINVENYSIVYEIEHHPGNGSDEPVWDDVRILSIENTETAETVDIKTFREVDNKEAERRIFDAIYGDRQSKKRGRIPVPNDDRVQPGDSGDVPGGNEEESKDDGHTDEAG